ncbi:hypothetical protein [Tabrizicola aquatica]|uniref:hypothetical protein n=1 Tax=Tabrizicola aquatica TaxID=909926 RepID=UPI0011AF45EB|nr:hypothetical protein [Tabrizicola aquatica]
MLNRPARLTASIAAMLTATTAMAEPTIEELDMRMRAMENTMQSILELLQEQQATGTSPAVAPSNDSAEAPAAVPAGYQMGALYLDVFTRTFSNNEYTDMFYNPGKLPDGPMGVPSGSAISKVGGAFSFGAFSEEATLSQFSKADALVGVQWSGVIEIEEEGPHTISIQLKKGSKSVGSCRSVLRLSGKIIADAKGDYRGDNDEQIDVAQTTQDLTTGLYDFSLWTTCVNNRENAMQVVSTEVSIAAPGDRAPKPISPERFGVQP